MLVLTYLIFFSFPRPASGPKPSSLNLAHMQRSSHPPTSYVPCASLRLMGTLFQLCGWRAQLLKVSLIHSSKNIAKQLSQVTIASYTQQIDSSICTYPLHYFVTVNYYLYGLFRVNGDGELVSTGIGVEREATFVAYQTSMSNQTVWLTDRLDGLCTIATTMS